MSTFDDFLRPRLVKTAQAAPGPDVYASPGLAPALGLQMPWRGALLGGLGYGVYDYLFGDDDTTKGPGRFLRKGLTGAVTGAGAETGLRLGGELARRHAANGGGGVATAITPVATTGLGAGLGYWLSRERNDDEEEEQN